MGAILCEIVERSTNGGKLCYSRARFEQQPPPEIAHLVSVSITGHHGETHMSLEQALVENTAALQALTAALKAGGTAPASEKAPAAEKSTKTTKTTKTEEPKGYQAKHTTDEMIAALTELKESKGLPEAKKIIKEVGKKEKMGEITDPATVDAVYEAAKAALGGDEEGEGDGL